MSVYASNIGKQTKPTTSLSGHSQQRPPTPRWPQITAAPTINVMTYPSQQWPPF